jgi:hypothetical protein
MEANISEKEIDSLSGKKVNERHVGRGDYGECLSHFDGWLTVMNQIKNFARTGMEFASWKNEPLSVKHLKIVIEAGEAFEVDYQGYGPTESLRSYT